MSDSEPVDIVVGARLRIKSEILSKLPKPIDD